MEEYKIKLINDAKDLSLKIEALSDKIEKFSKDTEFDPIELSLMKSQLNHMNNYFGSILIRCECTFKPKEFEEMQEVLNGSN